MHYVPADMTDVGNHFSATAFHPGFPGGRAGGRIQPTPLALRFESPTGFVDLPWAGILLRFGGHDGRQLFFEHPARPGTSITTSAIEVLDHPLLAGRGELRQQADSALKTSRTWSRGWILLGILALALVALIVWVVSQRDWLVRAVADRVPINLEIEVGNKLFEQIRGEGRLVRDEALERQLNRVTTRLLPAVANTGYAFQFHIAQDTNINAYAIPGGHVFVNSGLLRAVKRPEELAGVLAHELAHVTRRHGIRQVVSAAGLYLMVQFFLGDTSGMQAVLVEGSQMLLQQKYSRDSEREADAVGWDYLLEANIDPSGMIGFFRLMQAEEQRLGGLGQSLSFLSTHPATEERLRHLEEKWKRLERKSGFVELAPKTVHLP